MAPGPRVLIQDNVELQNDISEDEEVSAGRPMSSKPKMRYYRTEKVLGRLYRAIDEQEFFATLKMSALSVGIAPHGPKSMMQRLWDWVKEKMALIEWEHHIEWAKGIKEMSAPPLLTIYRPHD